MGFAEELSGDGSLTGCRHPWGHGHTVAFLIPRFRAAMTVAFLVVLVELALGLEC